VTFRASILQVLPWSDAKGEPAENDSEKEQEEEHEPNQETVVIGLVCVCVLVAENAP